ncbi:MAG: Vms1/Ankzf1 family peptidyl-tRNA hydrolase [Candidatus Aenigmatarchaeota archaeon]
MEEKILRKSSMLKLIKELESYEGEADELISAYIKKRDTISQKIPEEIRIVLEKILMNNEAIVFYWSKLEKNIIIVPPIPIKEEFYVDKKFRVEQLKEIFTKKYLIGVILVRIGDYAIGIFDGDKLILSKCGSRFVTAKQKKGGSSAARFGRIRKLEVENFLKGVRNELKKFEPYIERLDYVFFGGTGITIKKLLSEKIDKKIEEKRVGRIIDIKEINKKSLEKILEEIWKTKIIYV